MELRALRAFVEVVRHGGFSEAAKVIHTTQSTVSKSVKQIENELSAPLLNRFGRVNTLTAAGEIVHRHALAMLSAREDMIRELDELRLLRRGRLQLGLPMNVGVMFAPVIAAFRRKYPDIALQLVEHGSKRLEEMLLAGEIEVAVLFDTDTGLFETETLGHDSLVALLPPGHPLAGAPSADLARLAASPFVLFPEGFMLNGIVMNACTRRGLKPTVAARSGQVEFTVELVASGLGVGFLPRSFAGRGLAAGLAVVPVDEPETDWRLVLAHRRGGYLSHAAAAWLQFARERGDLTVTGTGLPITA